MSGDDDDASRRRHTKAVIVNGADVRTKGTYLDYQRSIFVLMLTTELVAVGMECPHYGIRRLMVCTCVDS